MNFALFPLDHAGETNATARLAMVISSRHRLIGALVLAMTGLSVGGCQNAVSVGAVNHCDVDVEIQADSVSESTTRWATLGAGDQASVVDVSESAETLYVRVRAPDTEEIRRVVLPMTSLQRPPADVDYEAELVLAGDRCP
jgi:hypothetical protein